MALLKLFLSGDVMTGRGIDQVMRHPGDPTLFEQWARSAEDYVDLAEQRSGPMPRGVEPSYVWGDALDVLEGADPDLRVINLETAITDRGEPWPGKGIHYRMHPENVGFLSAGRIDCVSLANNHILDWSYPGLRQTLESVESAGSRAVGAGEDLDSATRPVILDAGEERRLVVVAVGAESSGIAPSWAARAGHPGVAMTTLSPADVDTIGERIAAVARPGDVVVASIHWGPNWGYHIPSSHRWFAHGLIDRAGVHVIHGHSSHHPVAIEVHRGRPILYGCGDLINDYEGIRGHEEYRPDLGLIYLVTVDTVGGRLADLELVPMQMHRFRLRRVGARDRSWLRDRLAPECQRAGTTLEASGDSLVLRW